jgi:uncharacterized membrane protein
MRQVEVIQDRVYTQEDIQKILGLAIEQQAYNGEFSRGQLLEIAEDLGIPTPILHQAEQTWLQLQKVESQKAAFNQYRRASFFRRLGQSGSIIGVLVLAQIVSPIALIQGFLSLIIIAALLILGIPLGIQGWDLLHTQGEAYEVAFQNWQRKRQLRGLVNQWLGRLIGSASQ